MSPTTLRAIIAIVIFQVLLLSIAFALGFTTRGCIASSHENRRSPSLPAESVQLRDLKRLHDKALRRIQKLEVGAKRAQQRLRADDPSSQIESPDSLLQQKTTLAEVPRVDWHEVSKLAQQSLDALVLLEKHEKVSSEQETALAALRAEILKHGLAVRARNIDPCLDFASIAAFVRAFFGGTLGLTEEQLKSIEDSIATMYEKRVLDIDAFTSLRPLEKQALRDDLLSEVFASISSTISAEQAANWPAVKGYATGLLSDRANVHEHGIGLPDLSARIGFSWKQVYGLTEEQQPHAKELSAEYIAEAQELLQRYGATDEELATLSHEAKRKLEKRLLGIQLRYEEGLLPWLSQQQRDQVQDSPPTLIRFNYGTKSNYSAFARSF